MLLLGITIGTIIGMALGIALAFLVGAKKYKCEIEEIWIDSRKDADKENAQAFDCVTSEDCSSCPLFCDCPVRLETQPIKEFANRLKAKVCKPEQPWEEPYFFESDIDEVLKEMEMKTDV